MTDFYIKKLIISGTDKRTSSVEFSKGLNIICGPSDTGKSYVLEILDYLFGSDRIPIDTKHGYDTFEMVIATSKGEISIQRLVKDGAQTKTATVSSSDDRIESGEYQTTSGKLNLNEDLWLRIMGIEDRHKVICNQKCDTQRLTIRSLIHSMLIKEEQIIQRPSVLLPKYKPAAYIASLYYMMVGEDFAGVSPRTQQAMKEARKQAIIEFINKKLESIGERKKKIDADTTLDGVDDIEEKTRIYLDEIARVDREISEAIRKGQKLAAEIYDINDRLKESDLILDRQKALRTQYVSDLRRLGFVLEGDLKLRTISKSHICPLCHASVDTEQDPELAAATQTEAEHTRQRLKELVATESDLREENEKLRQKLKALDLQRSKVNTLINTELTPRLSELKKAFDIFKSAVERKKEKELLDQEEITLKSELFQNEAEETASDAAFDIKSHLGPDIMNVIDADIEEILRACHFDRFGSARFDVRSAFDIVVDGKTKYSYGKGYRAYLNTIVAFETMKYLSEHGLYNPGLLAIDSPILSLKETNETASDNMKKGLFTYLVNHQDYGQVIILENDIPDIDYSNTNVVYFTKNDATGRNGLLYEP